MNLKRRSEELGAFPYDAILPKLKAELDVLIDHRAAAGTVSHPVPSTIEKKPPSSSAQKKTQIRLQNAARRRKRLTAEGRLVLGKEIPRAAIAADPAKQSRYAKKLYYVDQEFSCVDCGKTEVWTATQQKWYLKYSCRLDLWGSQAMARAGRRRREELARHASCWPPPMRQKLAGETKPSCASFLASRVSPRACESEIPADPCPWAARVKLVEFATRLRLRKRGLPGHGGPR